MTGALTHLLSVPPEQVGAESFKSYLVRLSPTLRQALTWMASWASLSKRRSLSLQKIP